MISEGAHYKGVNTLIMFRRTQSSLVFNQQLGRIITLVRDEDPHAIVFDLVNNANLIENAGDRFAASLKRVYEARKEKGGKEKSDQIIIADYTEKISEVLERIKEKKCGFRAVYQIHPDTLEIIAEYKQIVLAAQAIKGSAGSIYQACYGKVGLANGYYWCFKEDWETWIPKENLSNHAVWCVELSQKYDKIIQAATVLGISRSSIIKSCNSWNIKAGGYHFCYFEDKDIWEPKSTQYHNQRAVWCVETQTEYASCAEAAQEYGTRSSDISAVCRKERQTCCGKHWCYIEDKDTFVLPTKKRNGNYKQVKCVETGIIYETAAEAQRQTGVRRGDIGAVCRGKQNTAGGYHWEYVEE